MARHKVAPVVGYVQGCLVSHGLSNVKTEADLVREAKKLSRKRRKMLNLTSTGSVFKDVGRGCLSPPKDIITMNEIRPHWT
jgi:hypothetical protein